MLHVIWIQETGETILDVKAVMSKLLRGTDLIVAGDLNIDLERTGGQGQYK